MPDCSMCGRLLGSQAEYQMLACGRCASVVGLVPMPPARRPPSPCQKCNHRKFVRCIPREHSGGRPDAPAQVSAPMYATYKPRMRHASGAQWAMPVEIESAGVGLLEMYICQRCGFVEWYCADVERITTHPAMMTEAIDYEAGAQAPYR